MSVPVMWLLPYWLASVVLDSRLKPTVSVLLGPKPSILATISLVPSSPDMKPG